MSLDNLLQVPGNLSPTQFKLSVWSRQGKTNDSSSLGCQVRHLINKKFTQKTNKNHHQKLRILI